MAYVISDDCIACGTCIDECPSGAISEGEKYSIDPSVCVDCGTCADVCPSGAIAPGEYSHFPAHQSFTQGGCFPTRGGSLFRRPWPGRRHPPRRGPQAESRGGKVPKNNDKARGAKER